MTRVCPTGRARNQTPSVLFKSTLTLYSPCCFWVLSRKEKKQPWDYVDILIGTLMFDASWYSHSHLASLVLKSSPSRGWRHRQQHSGVPKQHPWKPFFLLLPWLWSNVHLCAWFWPKKHKFIFSPATLSGPVGVYSSTVGYTLFHGWTLVS